MTPEKRRLMAELLDDERTTRREATLMAGGRILRRKRWRRTAFRSFAVVAVIAVGALFIRKSPPPINSTTVASVPAAPSQPKALTDDELLALFPNTPVALAKLENGKKRLIFPRPGDEEKFVTKL
jgi:hypothetical protein